MEQPLSYKLGRFIGRLPRPAKVALLAFGTALVLWVFTEPERQRKAESDSRAQATAVAAQRASAATARLKSECESNIQTKLSAYAELLASRKPREAADSIKHCASVLGDAELNRKVVAAEIASYTLAINRPQASLRERITSIDEFARVYPEDAKKFDRLRKNLEDQAARAQQQQERADRQRDLARRRSQGVSIGMSQEEVLQSSWGRPEKVNRSVYSFGIHEQWVYGGSNYLYFEDGRLTSIQTGGSR